MGPCAGLEILNLFIEGKTLDPTSENLKNSFLDSRICIYV
jgi:hypothetical protein